MSTRSSSGSKSAALSRVSVKRTPTLTPMSRSSAQRAERLLERAAFRRKRSWASPEPVEADADVVEAGSRMRIASGTSISVPLVESAV